MAEAAPRRATYAGLEAVPEPLVVEIVDGVLETHRLGCGPRDGAAVSGLSALLGPPVVVPDLAGWRRERMRTEPEAVYIETPPDWVCEILSPSTARLDRGPKRRICAEAEISHLWLLDLADGVLESFTLTAGQWLLTGTAARGEAVAAPPFDAAPFPLDDLFSFHPPFASPEA